MKKEVFIFVFITFILIISGAIFTSNQPNVISLGCGAPTTPANNNGGNSGEGSSVGYKHPANAQGLVTDFSKPIDAKYKYENIPTINWKFIVDRAGLVLNIPDVTIQGQSIKRYVPAGFGQTKYEKSTDNCQYYIFPYVRKAQTFQYNLIYKKAQTVDSVPHCVYDITPIQNDILAIASLGGDSLSGETIQVLAQTQQNSEATINLANLCTGFVDTSSPPNCVPTEQCVINVTLGESAFYGVKYDKDTAGNVVVLEDNNGLPIIRADAGQQISQADLNQAAKTRAENFIADCSKKYESKPQANCGNGKAEQNEECDKNDFKDFGDGKGKCMAYASEEFSSGDLTCNSNCKIETTNCVRKNVEILSVNFKLDYSDQTYNFDYLDYLNSRGISSSDYSTYSAINGSKYLSITPDTGFSATQEKGLVCVAKLNDYVSEDKIQFIVTAKDDSEATISTTTASGSNGNIVKSVYQGNFVYVYKVQKEQLPRGTNVQCQFNLQDNGQLKSKESGKIVIAKYVIFVLNAYRNELINDYIKKFFSKTYDQQKVEELMNYMNVMTPMGAELKLNAEDVSTVSEFNKNFDSSLKEVQITIPKVSLDPANPDSIDQLARPITSVTAKDYLVNKLGIFQFDQNKDLIVSYSYETLTHGAGVSEIGTRWHVMVLPFYSAGSSRPEITLAHEMGHAWANLCDEYQYTKGPTFFGFVLPWFPLTYGWAEQNVAWSCPNSYPECCKHEWGVTGGCGTWTSCPGMPFDSSKQQMNVYSEHRTMAVTDSRIKYFSLMGGSRHISENGLNLMPVIYPTKSDKTNYCPLEAYVSGGCK